MRPQTAFWGQGCCLLAPPSAVLLQPVHAGAVSLVARIQSIPAGRAHCWRRHTPRHIWRSKVASSERRLQPSAAQTEVPPRALHKHQRCGYQKAARLEQLSTAFPGPVIVAPNTAPVCAKPICTPGSNCIAVAIEKVGLPGSGSDARCTELKCPPSTETPCLVVRHCRTVPAVTQSALPAPGPLNFDCLDKQMLHSLCSSSSMVGFVAEDFQTAHLPASLSKAMLAMRWPLERSYTCRAEQHLGHCSATRQQLTSSKHRHPSSHHEPAGAAG